MVSEVPLYNGLSRDAVKHCGQAPVDASSNTRTRAARLFFFTRTGPTLKPGRICQGALLMRKRAPIGPCISPIYPLNGQKKKTPEKGDHGGNAGACELVIRREFKRGSVRKLLFW